MTTNFAMKTWLRLLLILMTVGGGFTGFAFTLQGLFSASSVLNFLLTLAFVGLYSFVTISGLLFVQDPSRIRPILAALAIQVPSISLPFFAYHFAAGFDTFVGLRSAQAGDQTSFHLSGLIGGMWQLAFLRDNPLLIGINPVALTLFLILWRARQQSRCPNEPNLIPLAE